MDEVSTEVPIGVVALGRSDALAPGSQTREVTWHFGQRTFRPKSESGTILAKLQAGQMKRISGHPYWDSIGI